MNLGIREHLLPHSQLRTLEELSEDQSLRAGDARAKQSAFWVMLTLSGLIASAGILTDSTATVIGAMIIAPLATPIMGIAVNLTTQERSGALIFALGGVALIVSIGFVFSFAVPESVNLLTNSQIAGRTSPRLLDLVAAIATGLAGATALSRRDVAAVLPGVAIAISLVPPLAVVGICLGQGNVGLAAGAAMLFLSNFLALVLMGTLMFTALGYRTAALNRDGAPRRGAYATLGSLTVLVVFALGGNTVVHTFLLIWSDRVQTTAESWIVDTPGAEVIGVENVGAEFRVVVRSPGALPAIALLVEQLDGQVPDYTDVVVIHEVGERIESSPRT